MLTETCIKADWGDHLKVHVTNNLANNGTAVHWHGLRQLNSAEYDGVPGVTQCPIAPGESLTYVRPFVFSRFRPWNGWFFWFFFFFFFGGVFSCLTLSLTSTIKNQEFDVTQYGSTWYHSHFSLQYAEGLYGGMILNGPATADYDEDLGMLSLSDWSHTPAFALWDSAKNGGPPTMENGLINGTNTFEGAGAKFETVFEAGKKYRFRVVNAAADGHFQLSLDGHKLTIIGNDLVPIVPYTTDALSVSMGQRYDVIVEANAPSGDYWLRAQWVSACSTNYNPDGITGIVRYDASSTADPTSRSTVTTDQTCNDEPLESLVPHLALDVTDLTTTAFEELNFATGGPWFQWTINGSSLEIDWDQPTLLRMTDGETSFPTDYNVVTVDKKKSNNEQEFVVLVIEDDTGFGVAHPVHLHGHDFWVLAQATGMYNGSSNFNLANPPRRDVATLPGNGYLAVAFALDNPGAWLVHCHIAWHASEGLALEFVESRGAYDMGAADRGVATDQCAAWSAYAGTGTYAAYPQDDSGI